VREERRGEKRRGRRERREMRLGRKKKRWTAA
jgi:hypothetical protein